MDRLVKFGKPPIASAWDGSYSAVERYLKKVAKDPDSVKIASCTSVMHTKTPNFLFRGLHPLVAPIISVIEAFETTIY